MNKIFVAVAFLLSCSVARAQTDNSARLIIVQDGQPQAVIVTADRPSESAKRAIAEMQHFIELMSGAKLPVLTESATLPADKVRLLIGRSKLINGVTIPAGEDRDHS